MNTVPSNPAIDAISVENVKKGNNSLTEGATVVFINGKTAVLKKPEIPTFATAGCLKYYHPEYEKDCYIKVENNRLLNHIGTDVVGVDHFILSEEVAA